MLPYLWYLLVENLSSKFMDVIESIVSFYYHILLILMDTNIKESNIVSISYYLHSDIY